MVIRTILSQDGHRWSSEGVDTPILGPVSVLGWADNLVFIARSEASAQKVINEFTTSMHQRGMHWKPSSLQFLQVGRMGVTSPRPSEKRSRAGESASARVHVEKGEARAEEEGSTITAARLTWEDREGRRQSSRRYSNYKFWGASSPRTTGPHCSTG